MVKPSSSFCTRKVTTSALAVSVLSCKVWNQVYMKGVKAEENKNYIGWETALKVLSNLNRTQSLIPTAT